MAHLEIPAVKDDQGARTFDLLGSAVIVGRAEGNDLVIIDGTLSRKHCEFFATDDGGWGVRDLGSRNGVVIRGRRLKGEHLLNGGDVLVLGRVEIVYRDGDGGGGDDDDVIDLGAGDVIEMGDPGSSLEFDELDLDE